MLLLDIGNSTVKGQWWDDGELRQTFSCHFQNGWQARLAACLADTGAERCFFSSVQDAQVESDISGLLKGFIKAPDLVRLVAKKNCCGVKNAYSEPATLGIDRWLNLLGAAGLIQQDAIIIDAGSAITIDLLRADGMHLGGAILPGFDTSIKQFKRIMRNADFEHVEISHTEEPGCFTEACINIDYQKTDAVTVERLVDRWSGRLASDTVLIVAGGGASYLHRRLSRAHRLVPDLAFRGMRRQLEQR
ncbi:MAG: type III pantothenate kinase [Gammaproteobacteria bacterium]